MNAPTQSSDPRPNYPAQKPAPFSTWYALQTILSVAVIMASLLTLWTPTNLFFSQRMGELLVSVQITPEIPANQTIPQPTFAPAITRVGIIAGHWGHDTGAVCQDGLREVDVNLQIASIVKQRLIELGYEVDLLEEFDKRLFEYQADALISIHNDSCEYYNDEATGFKVAAAVESLYPEKASRLTNCLSVRYQELTGMKYHFNTVTNDMTSYHAFKEIHSNTPTAIIETGFLNLDRQILTQEPDRVAQGVVAGILCYLNNESVNPAEVPQP